MRKIRVIRGGCGVTITDANGNVRHTLKTPKDEPFECDNALAARFVGLKVAVYVDAETVADQPEECGRTVEQEAEEVEEATQEAEEPSAHLSAEALEEWDYNDLKKLAAEMGVTPEGKKKADYIAALVAADIEVDGEEEDDLPELDVADPE